MKLFKAVTLFLLSVASSLAMAGPVVPYDQAAFDKLAQEGKPVVVVVHAPWCPTCKVQKPIQFGLMEQPAYKDVTMMTIDFDSQKPLLAKYKVAMQSTMISFKGGQEVGRSVGDTSAAGIEGLVKKTLN